MLVQKHNNHANPNPNPKIIMILLWSRVSYDRVKTDVVVTKDVYIFVTFAVALILTL